MTTFSLDPTYFRVTWSNLTPNNYTALSGNQNGGLDSETAWQINSLVMTTGTTQITGSPMSTGDAIIINGTIISFVAADTLTTILSKINLASKVTNVWANQLVSGGYITLQNAPGNEGTPFWIADSVAGTLAKLGFVAGTYNAYPTEVGTTFTAVTTNSNVTINGTFIQFTGGPLTTSGVATQLNAQTRYTSVVASAAGPYLQLAGVNGQPWSINAGNAVANMGFTIGNHGGFPDTLANSQAKERANMRWTQMIAEIESNATPIELGYIERTGNLANVATDTISFTVGYNQLDQVWTVAAAGEPNAGNILYADAAIKRQVARAMVANMRSNRKLYDPTLESFGSFCDQPNAVRIESVTAQGIDIVANIAIVEQNITVTQIPNV